MRFSGCLFTAALLCVFCLAPRASASEPLSVLQCTPGGEVESLTQIVIRFSEPMRPLGVMEEKADDAPARLEAAEGSIPPGSWLWLDPSTLAYLLDEPVVEPVRMTIVIPRGVAALSDARLDAERRFSVSTPPLALSAKAKGAFDPNRGGALPPQGGVIELSSNYRLDPQSIRASLASASGPVSLGPLTEPDWQLQQRDTDPGYWFYTLPVTGPVRPGERLTLRLEPGFTTWRGTDLRRGFIAAIDAYQPLAVLGMRPEEAKPGEPASPHATLSFQFSNAVRHGEVLRHLRIEPAVEFVHEETPDADAESHYFGVSCLWQPGVRYTVTLQKGLRDEYGLALDRDVTRTFTVGDFSPSFFMKTGDMVLEKSEGTRFPLELMNIDAVTVRLYGIPWNTGGYAAYAPSECDAKALERLAAMPGVSAKTLALDFSNRRNQLVTHNIDIAAELDGAFTRGFVVLAAEARLGNSKQPAVFCARLQTTGLGLTMKRGMSNSLAFVTDLQSGAPLEGVSLSLVDASGEALWQGESDKNGLAFAPGLAALPEGEPLFLAASRDADQAVLPVRERDSRWNQTDIYTPSSFASNRAERLAARALPQLPLYEPGQEVNYVLFIRRHVFADPRDAALKDVWLPPAKRPLELEVLDSRQKTVHRLEAQSNAYGSVNGGFTLPGDAALGAYTFRVRHKDSDWLDAGSFKVAEFRPPEFRVDLTAPPSQVLAASEKRQEPLGASVQAGYFSGAPLPGGLVSLAVTPSGSDFKPGRLNGYVTGIAEPFPFFRYPLRDTAATPLSVQGRLDATGNAALTLPPLAAEPGQPLNVALEATVTDASGLASQGDASFILHPSAYYVGLKGPRFAVAGAPFTLDIKAASADNEPLSGIAVTLRAERRLETRGDEERYETVWTKDLSLEKAEGERFSVSLEQGGLYRLQAETADPSGRTNISRLTVYVPGGPAAWFGPRDADVLELASDADEYRPGATARIIIKNPYGKATALVTTERDGVRAARVLAVDGPAPEIAIPVFADDAPYVYVGVTLLRGRVEKAAPAPSEQEGMQQDGQRTGGPEASRKMVVIDAEDDNDRPLAAHAALLLAVREDRPELAVELKTDAAAYRPGGTVAASVRVSRTNPGSAPSPAKAQITLLAVDERILRAAGEGGEETSCYDPSPAFAPLRLHLVATSDLRVMLTGLSRFFNRQYTTHFCRTAAGGGYLAAPAAPMMQADSSFMARQKTGAADMPARADFGPLAYWLAAGETDGNGELNVSFTLPDTLTGYRIVAVAADAEGRFAKAEESVTASKPLQVLPALPRFMIAGDTLEARFLLQNLGPHDGEANVELRLEGSASQTAIRAGSADGSATVRAAVKAGGDAVVSFPVTAGATGTARLTVTATLGQESDAAVFTLPVLPAAPLTAVAASGMLKPGKTATLPVALPPRLDPRSALEVTLAASPAAGMTPALRQLLEYPYECLEQRLSKAWARAVRLEHGSTLGFAPERDDKERIRETLKSAASFQTRDGGFALWPGYERGDLYLTAYALLAADHMRPLGAALDPEVETRAYAYLADALRLGLDPDNAERHVERGFSGDAPETDAFALWALARNAEHRQDAAALWALVYDRALARPHEGAPLLWCSLLLAASELPDLPEKDARLQRLIAELEKTARITPTQMHFETTAHAGHWMTMGSSLRDNGMALAALTAVRPEYPRLDALAFWLSQGLGERTTLSTQEAVFGFRGLALFLKHFSGDGTAALDAVWDGNETFGARFARLVDPPVVHRVSPLPGGKETALALTAREGAPCWTARLVYASADSPGEAKNAGFTLKRKTAPTAEEAAGQKSGQEAKTAEKTATETATEATWRMGDEVTVTLTLYVPASRRHVLLFDPFPAGLEPLYASRTDLADRNLQNQYPWQYQDLHKDGLMLYAPVIEPGVYTFTYKLRAAFPGAFTHRPAQVEEMYTPEVMGRCAGKTVVVSE